ncbi:hypothetical protein NA57DRAFT_61586 [Rhizodiscina lignyota]|uniref:Uncharacterized protein n=1 Tax=Rhizodiscina lignyota TaxID=1504668 RepID=A0A9P4I1V8_9PEZI|nr:hypothetical protein NA57DRAFT_61586 [Rhizodiscina lignyota]
MGDNCRGLLAHSRIASAYLSSPSPTRTQSRIRSARVDASPTRTVTYSIRSYSLGSLEAAIVEGESGQSIDQSTEQRTVRPSEPQTEQLTARRRKAKKRNKRIASYVLWSLSILLLLFMLLLIIIGSVMPHEHHKLTYNYIETLTNALPQGAAPDTCAVATVVVYHGNLMICAAISMSWAHAQWPGLGAEIGLKLSSTLFSTILALCSGWTWTNGRILERVIIHVNTKIDFGPATHQSYDAEIVSWAFGAGGYAVAWQLDASDIAVIHYSVMSLNGIVKDAMVQYHQMVELMRGALSTDNDTLVGQVVVPEYAACDVYGNIFIPVSLLWKTTALLLSHWVVWIGQLGFNVAFLEGGRNI